MNMHVTHRPISVRSHARIHTEVVLLELDDELWSWHRNDTHLGASWFHSSFWYHQLQNPFESPAGIGNWEHHFVVVLLLPGQIQSVLAGYGGSSLFFCQVPQSSTLSPHLFYNYMKSLGELICQFRVLHHEYTDHIQISLLTMS